MKFFIALKCTRNFFNYDLVHNFIKLIKTQNIKHRVYNMAPMKYSKLIIKNRTVLIIRFTIVKSVSTIFIYQQQCSLNLPYISDKTALLI